MNRSYLVLVRSFLISLALCLFILVFTAHAQDEVLSPDNAAQIDSLFVLGEKVEGGLGFVEHLVYSADGRFIAATSANGWVRVWRPEDRSLVYEAQAPVRFDSIGALGISPDGRIVAVAYKQSVILYDVEEGAELMSLPTDYVTDIFFSPDGDRVTVHTSQGVVATWSMTRGEQIQAFEIPDSPWAQGRFSDDGTMLATWDEMGNVDTIQIWRIAGDLTLQATLTGHTDYVFNAGFSPDGSTLASTSGDDTVRLWRTSDGAPLSTLTGHDESASGVAFSPDGRMLASSSCCDEVRLWQVADGTPLAVLSEQVVSDSLSLAFSPDGKTLAAGLISGDVNFLGIPATSGSDGTTGRPAATPSVSPTTGINPDTAGRVVLLNEWQSPGVEELDHSPDGRYLALAMSTGVSLRDAVTLEEKRFFETLIWSYSVAFSPDGKILAGGFMDGSTWLWRVDDGSLIETYHGHADIVTGLAFSPDGQLLASSSNDGSVQIRRVTDGTIVNTLNEISEVAEYDYIADVEFSADGSLLAASVLFGKGVEERRVVMVWRVSDGAHLKSLESQTSSEVEYFDLAFSPAGGYLIAAGHWQTEGWTVPGLDAMLNYRGSPIWDYFQTDELEALGISGQDAEAADFAWSVDYSVDGQLLAIGAKGRIKLLQADGFPLAILKTQVDAARIAISPSQSESLVSPDAVNSLAFSPDGQTLASSSSDGTVQIWGVGIESATPPDPPPPLTPPVGATSHGRPQIAYVVTPSDGLQPGRGNIWLADDDGGNPQQLTDSGQDCCAVWSPDGARLYYVRPSYRETGETDHTAIIERDLATGEERVFSTTPFLLENFMTNLIDDLAVSPDGRALVYAVNTVPGGEEAAGLQSYACLYQQDLATNVTRELTCYDGEIVAGLEFVPGGETLIIDLAANRSARTIAYHPASAEETLYPDVCCFESQLSGDGHIFAIGNHVFMESAYQENGWQDTGIFEYLQGAGEPIPLLISDEINLPMDLSPEGDRLVYQRGASIEILDIATGRTIQVIAGGQQPTWRPGDYADGVQTSIGELISRKNAIFDELEAMAQSPQNLPAIDTDFELYDEAAANRLVMELSNADPASLTPESVAAIERLVLQEETMVALLKDYSAVVDDNADVVVHLVGLTLGTRYMKAASEHVGDLAIRALESFLKMLTNSIKDEDIGELVELGIDKLLLDYSLREGNFSSGGETLLEWAIDAAVPWSLKAGIWFPDYIALTQPAIDQGVRSVNGSPAPVWPVEGTADMATKQLSTLTGNSSRLRELTHDAYENHLATGRDFNDYVMAVADLLGASGANKYLLIAQIQTRVENLLIDITASSILADAAACTRNAALRAGGDAFQPGQRVYVCENPIPLDYWDFIRRLISDADHRTGHFGRLAPPSQESAEFSTALVGYQTSIENLRDAVENRDTAVEGRVEELVTAAATFDNIATQAMVRLDPAADEVNAEGRMALGVAITMVRLDAYFALLAADTYLQDPNAAEIETFSAILDTAEENADIVAQVQAANPIPVAPVFALPLVDVPTSWAATIGDSLSIPVQVKNVGGSLLEDGLLTLERDGQSVVQQPIPNLAPGESVEVVLEYEPPAPGKFWLRVNAVAGDKKDYRSIDLTVTEIAGSEEVPSPADSSSSQLDDTRKILLGIMAVSGVVFAAGLGAFVMRRRRA